MLEGSAQEISMANLLEAMAFGARQASLIPSVISSIVAKHRPNKLPDESLTTPTSLSSLVNDWLIK